MKINDKLLYLYTIIKRLYGSEYRLGNKIYLLEKILFKQNKKSIKSELVNFIESIPSINKKIEYYRLFDDFSQERIKFFKLAVKIFLLKNSIKFNKFDKKIENLHPLSLNYDVLSTIYNAYGTRLDNINFSINSLSNINKDLYEEVGLNFDEIKIIFLLIMSESINQSIKSNAGTNYESRVEFILKKLNIDNLTKYSHEDIKSIEYDFMFNYKGKKFGVSAKRTLRERYKQFVNMGEKLSADILIAITLGTDLTLEKAKTIINDHKVNLFISPEVLSAQPELKSIGVNSIEDLSNKFLDKLL